MTTPRDTITQALRETNLISINGVPTAIQLTEGLNKLNSLLQSVMDFEVGTKLAEWPVGAEGTDGYVSSWSSSDWATPPQNVQLMVTDPTTQTITLPAFPDNGARVGLIDLTNTLAAHPITLDPQGKKIQGGYVPLTVNVNGANLQWMYRRDLGDWVLLSVLGLDDNLPFPIRFDDYFQIMLAARLNPRYGRSLTQESTAALARQMAQLRATYRQKRAVRAPIEVLCLPNTGNRGIVDDITGVATATGTQEFWVDR